MIDRIASILNRLPKLLCLWPYPARRYVAGGGPNGASIPSRWDVGSDSGALLMRHFASPTVDRSQTEVGDTQPGLFRREALTTGPAGTVGNLFADLRRLIVARSSVRIRSAIFRARAWRSTARKAMLSGSYIASTRTSTSLRRTAFTTHRGSRRCPVREWWSFIFG